MAKGFAVTSTGDTGLKHVCTGFFFTNLHATQTSTIILKSPDTSGTIVWEIALQAGTSVGWDWGGDSLNLRHYSVSSPGLYCSITSGTIQGAVFGR